MQSATGTLQIAGSLSGVPYAGAVAVVIAGIVETTQRVQVCRVSPRISALDLLGANRLLHQAKCDRLAIKTNLLISTLQEQAERLEGTEMQQAVDQVQL
jgi:hypothetical protein